jgi:2-isopropylmalate synthase
MATAPAGPAPARTEGDPKMCTSPSVEPLLRTWPSRTVTKAPRWLSTDLAVSNSISLESRLTMFDLLVRMGYTEIDIGPPEARAVEFVRRLIDQDRIPDDVRICVRARIGEDDLRHTLKTFSGARRVLVNLRHRDFVPEVGHAENRATVVRATEQLARLAADVLGDCDVACEYSPGECADSGMEFALEVSEAVTAAWRQGSDREVIVNVPRTRATSNAFADRVEWMGRHLPQHDQVCLSVRPHNDYGTAIADAELAVMAGAERVAGRLFGGPGGTRACLVTLGLNLHSHGIDPGIDFSHIDEIRSTVERCAGIRVHERHPYVGDLVYTSFAGSHQDAIKKGFEAMDKEAAATGIPVERLRWSVPYLPIDPADVGRSYKAVVRVNSQSGKGGVAYLMKAEHGLDLPRQLQAELSGVVQRQSECSGEITADQMWNIFESEYLANASSTSRSRWSAPGSDHRSGSVENVCVLDRHEHELTPDLSPEPGAKVACFAECLVGEKRVWGVGIDTDRETAQRKAVLSAVYSSAA